LSDQPVATGCQPVSPFVVNQDEADFTDFRGKAWALPTFLYTEGVAP